MALTYVELIITAPDSITDSMFEEVQRHFSNEEIIELSYVALYFNTSHRFAGAVHVDSPDGENLVVRTIDETYPAKAPAGVAGR